MGGTPVPGYQMPLLTSVGTRHVCSTYTYMQAKYPEHKIIKLLFKTSRLNKPARSDPAPMREAIVCCLSSLLQRHALDQDSGLLCPDDSVGVVVSFLCSPELISNKASLHKNFSRIVIAEFIG